jgi:two-component sensor histidine kinase
VKRSKTFKYAFDDERIGHVYVELAATNDGLVLSVSDDGKDRPHECEAGLGTRLVTLFAARHGEDAAWEAGPRGSSETGPGSHPAARRNFIHK